MWLALLIDECLFTWLSRTIHQRPCPWYWSWRNRAVMNLCRHHKPRWDYQHPSLPPLATAAKMTWKMARGFLPITIPIPWQRGQGRWQTSLSIAYDFVATMASHGRGMVRPQPVRWKRGYGDPGKTREDHGGHGYGLSWRVASLGIGLWLWKIEFSPPELAFVLVFDRKKTKFLIPKYWLAQKLRKTVSEKVNTEWQKKKVQNFTTFYWMFTIIHKPFYHWDIFNIVCQAFCLSNSMCKPYYASGKQNGSSTCLWAWMCAWERKD